MSSWKKHRLTGWRCRLRGWTGHWGGYRIFATISGSGFKIRTGESINGQKRFTGILEGVEGTDVRLHIHHQPLTIPFEAITKAQVVGSDGI